MTLIVILTGLLQLAIADDAALACGQNANAQALASLIIGHESQQRPELQCNELLSAIAAQRAVDLLDGSNTDELTPNEILTEHGFKFPTYYPRVGNQVEASATEVETPESALEFLARSYKHRDLVLGNDEFFERQSHLGVGYYKNEQNETQYVVLIAEAYSSPKIVFKQEFVAPNTATKEECGKTWRSSSNDELRKACRELWQKKKDEKKAEKDAEKKDE